MMSYENITKASTPKGSSEILTHEKENTKQSNTNTILKCLCYLLEILGLH